MTTGDPTPEAMQRARKLGGLCTGCNGHGLIVYADNVTACPGCLAYGWATPPSPRTVADAIDAAVAEAMNEMRRQAAALRDDGRFNTEAARCQCPTCGGCTSSVCSAHQPLAGVIANAVAEGA